MDVLVRMCCSSSSQNSISPPRSYGSSWLLPKKPMISSASQKKGTLVPKQLPRNKIVVNYRFLSSISACGMSNPGRPPVSRQTLKKPKQSYTALSPSSPHPINDFMWTRIIRRFIRMRRGLPCLIFEKGFGFRGPRC